MLDSRRTGDIMDASSNRATFLILAYLWPLAVVPLVLEKHDAEVQWHARHGLVLMAFELLVLFAFSLVTGLVSLMTLGLGCALSLFTVVLWIAILVLHFVAMLKALGGTRLIVPGISVYADKF